MLGFVLGCGPQTMPKGSGASGEPIDVVVKPDLGLDLINHLSPDEEEVLQWMHRDFAACAEVGTTVTDPLIERVRAGWNTVVFADAQQQRRFVHRARLVTNVGTVAVDLFDTVGPAIVRNFVVLAGLDHYRGAQFRRDGPFAVAGSPPEQEPFRIRRQAMGVLPPVSPGMLVALPAGGELAATRLAICVEDPREVPDGVVCFGSLADGPTPGAVQSLIESLIGTKTGAVQIERIEVQTHEYPLFTTQGANLPPKPEGLGPLPSAPVPDSGNSQPKEAAK